MQRRSFPTHPAYISLPKILNLSARGILIVHIPAAEGLHVSSTHTGLHNKLRRCTWRRPRTSVPGSFSQCPGNAHQSSSRSARSIDARELLALLGQGVCYPSVRVHPSGHSPAARSAPLRPFCSRDAATQASASPRQTNKLKEFPGAGPRRARPARPGKHQGTILYVSGAVTSPSPSRVAADNPTRAHQT